MPATIFEEVLKTYEENKDDKFIILFKLCQIKRQLSARQEHIVKSLTEVYRIFFTISSITNRSNDYTVFSVIIRICGICICPKSNLYNNTKSELSIKANDTLDEIWYRLNAGDNSSLYSATVD